MGRPPLNISLTLAGAVLACAGIALIYTPAALICAGLGLAAVGLLLEESK